MRLRQPLIRRHKKLARAVLYLSPFVLWFVSVPIIRELRDLEIDNEWTGVDYEQMESFRLLRQYIQIDSSYPDGNEIPAAEFLASVLAEEGIDSHVERVGERNANLWAILEGDDPRPLVLHQHVDVDPILYPEKWRRPPFAAVYEPPHLYGRGAFDMKGVGIAQLMAMLDLKRSGTRPSRSLMLLATGDEERNSFLGTQRLLRQHPEWASEFWAVLTEGGAVEALSAEEIKYWGTEFQQKRFVSIWICSSYPEQLEDVRAAVNRRRSERRVGDAARVFFPAYGPSRVRETTRDLLADPDALVDRLRGFPRDVEVTDFPPILESLTRDEVWAFPIKEAPGGGYRFEAILHLLPDSDFASAYRELIGDRLDGLATRIEVINEMVPASPLDHPVFVAIGRVLEDRYPGVEHGPLLVPWSATDARFFRDVGIPAYGFSPFLMVTADAQSSKGPNERIPAPAFVDGVGLYQSLVRELLARD